MINRLRDARRQTDDLFAVVREEALYDRSIPERHRVIFYVGHLEAFDWNLISGTLGLTALEPALDRLFAFGIDPVDGGLPSDTPGDWPSLKTVLAYRDQIRAKLDASLTNGVDPQLLHVAIEHRLMHAETLAYMFHQLPLDRKIPLDVARVIDAPETAAEIQEVPMGAAILGLPRDGGHFGWDNEFDSHTVNVPAFAIDRYKVTNGQFLRFLTEGGYEHRAFWSDSDWEWKSSSGVSHPVFWTQSHGAWRYRSMFDEIPLPLMWPVYVSHAEASAYSKWAGKTLPTEAQWHRASEGCNWSLRTVANVWDPWPVSASPSGRSAAGVEGILGNGWEWTSTPFAPFDGFRQFPFYPGYSADFFDGKHFVMKGGSVRTASCMLRPSFRNWFQPHYPYIYAGFRCVNG